MSMDASINIVELIENNPITLLSGTYQGKLLSKIKATFTNIEQQMFVSSFYCYLNHNQLNDFVIDLDDVWKWIGYNQKVKAKSLLETGFIVGKDYQLLLSLPGKQSGSVRGGHNKQKIMLTINTFKRFCLKAGTTKADQIHEYYIKLEEMLHEVIQTESNELKLQLDQTQLELRRQIITAEMENVKIRETTLLEHFPNNTQCVYYGVIDNVSDKNEPLVKFGNSNNLKNRVKQHRDTYRNFRLINAFKVENKLQIENAMKDNAVLNERHRTITLQYKKYVELLCMDGITFSELDKIIKSIITEIEYSPANYIKLLDENRMLKKQLDNKNETNNTDNFILLTAENKRLVIENIRLLKKIKKIPPNTTAPMCTEGSPDSHPREPHEPLPEEPLSDEIDNYGCFINKCKKITKNKDGKYNISGKIYDNLFGSRHDVWYGNAYKTTGGLIKSDLLMNRNGKIISKKKCIYETTMSRFEKYGVNASKNVFVHNI